MIYPKPETGAELREIQALAKLHGGTLLFHTDANGNETVEVLTAEDLAALTVAAALDLATRDD